MSSQQDQINLGPLFEPDPVQFQFETPGWYFVFAVLLVVAVITLIRALRTYVKNAYRRKAVQLLQSIEARFEEKRDADCITEVMVLLKHVSMTTFDRKNVAELYGSDWISFLEITAKGISFKKYEALLSQAAYQNLASDTEHVSAFFSASKKWIRTHA